MSNKRKKRILLMGYYGFNNMGDEAVLESIIQQLREHAPDCELQAMSNNPAATAAAYGIDCVDRWNLPKLALAILRCDVFVAGGGSLLQDITGPRSLQYYLYLLRAAQLLRKKTFFYAQGIGPINDEKNRKKTAKVLRRCAYLTVRDTDAKAYMQDLGIDGERVAVTCDPVLAFRCKEYAPLLPMGLKMGFSLRECKGFSAEAMAKVADYFAEKGWTIVFLPFCRPDDEAVSRLVMGLMQHRDKSYIVKETELPRDMMATIAACNFVVGIRLHSLIMASSCGIPFAALSYDPKIDGFCHELGLQAAALASESNADIIIKGIEQAMKENDIKQRLAAAKNNWKQLAAANAKLLNACAHGEEKADLSRFMSQKQSK